MEDLKQWPQQNQTHPEFAGTIIDHLNAWRTNGTRPVIGGLAWAKPAFEAQTNMGWKNFFEGFLAVEWQEVQALHFARIGSKNFFEILVILSKGPPVLKLRRKIRKTAS
jgi:hypothetical protein